MRQELESLQQQVIRQERLAAIGVLVSGIAHELNNPLQAILGSVEVVERQPDVPRDILDDIAVVKTQSIRAREIIRNLSRFSRQKPGPPTLVDLRDVIGSVVQLRKRELDSAGVSLDVETSSVRKVLASFAELEQVLLNFVVNAQQAIQGTGEKNGRILITLTDVGRKVRLEVWDDGPGVPQQEEQKLFQPFFTTKPVGSGTGLGLSVSYGIIDAYGGATGYFNNEWGGATFFVELPVAGESGDAKTSDDGTAVLRGRVSSRL
jgi:two-component system NtrC family sensor kinase